MKNNNALSQQTSKVGKAKALARAEAQARLLSLISQIKSCKDRKELPPTGLLHDARSLASEYPEDASFMDLLEQVTKTYNEAIYSVLAKEGLSATDIENFAKEVEKNPVQAMRNYFADPIVKKNIETLNKLLDSELFVDNDSSFKQFINLSVQVTSNIDRYKRQILCEHNLYKLEEFRDKEKAPTAQLSPEAKKEQAEIKEGCYNLVKSSVYDAVVTKKENKLQRSFDQFTHKEANAVVRETKEKLNILKSCAKGEMHKLTALAAYAPEAIQAFVNSDNDHKNISHLEVDIAKVEAISKDKAAQKSALKEQAKIKNIAVIDVFNDKEIKTTAEDVGTKSVVNKVKNMQSNKIAAMELAAAYKKSQKTKWTANITEAIKETHGLALPTTLTNQQTKLDVHSRNK